MSIANEIKALTGDAGARRLGEIADALVERLNRCCPEGDTTRPVSPAVPQPPSDPGEENRTTPR